MNLTHLILFGFFPGASPAEGGDTSTLEPKSTSITQTGRAAGVSRTGLSSGITQTGRAASVSQQ